MPRVDRIIRMTNDLTLTAALAMAVTALAAAVGVLWKNSVDQYKALEKRTESHLAVATEQMKVLAGMEIRLGTFLSAMERIGGEHSDKLDVLMGKIDNRNSEEILSHAGQMKVLATIEAVIMQRRVSPIMDKESRT